MEKLFPEQVSGWTKENKADIYDRETIFDYINGAGEVYLQYAYQKLYVHKYDKTDFPSITVEIFDMGSCRDAYGIFSHSYQGENAGIGSGSEYVGGLLCFWKGQYYICVSAEKSGEESKKAVFQLAGEIDRRIKEPGKLPDLIKYLPEAGLVESSIRYFHKHTSLNLHYYLASRNILGLGDETEAVLAEYEPGGMYILLVRYPDKEQAMQALKGSIDGYIPEADASGMARIQNNKWVRAISVKKYVIIVLDAPGAGEAEKLADSTRIKIENKNN